MASSDSTSALLECSICMEDFSEGNFPRTLPCTHVYCTECLSTLARDHGGEVRCPECREEHVIMDVERLRISRTTMQLKELKRTERTRREAKREIQLPVDSVPTISDEQAEIRSQTSASEIDRRLTSLRALMWEASQSGKNLEKAIISETQGRRATLLQAEETAKWDIENWIDPIVTAVTERKRHLLKTVTDEVQENLSRLSVIEEDSKARQESHKRFCREMTEKEAALRGDNQADPEEIDKLIKETRDRIDNFEDKIPIPTKDLSLDTNDERYQTVLTDVSSLGGIKITHEVTPIHPQMQSSIAELIQHYRAKTEATRTIDCMTHDFQHPCCVAQLPNGDIAVGSYNGIQIRVYDNDLIFKRVFSLPSGNRSPLFLGITGICATPNGKLYISDPGMKTVHVVTPEGILKSSFKTTFYPMGLASYNTGEVFVFDLSNQCIHVFNSSGRECGRFNGPRDEEPGIWKAQDLALTPDGKVLLTDAENHRIQVFDGTTGEYQGTFGSKGSEPNQLCKPEGIAVDSMGFVAVAEFGNHRVQLFTPHWKSFHTLHSQGDPRGIVFSKSNEVVVCYLDNNRINIF